MGDPTRLGRYTLLGRIGAGGMGEVFLARVEGPEGFEKRLALKRIAPALADDPRFRQRFAAEARLAAILEHPNVVQVYEFVEEAGALWLVMEYVDGGSLRAVLRRASEAGRPVPWPLFARIGADACAGLAYAHGLADGSGKRLGLVHRDVSPENLLLSRTGAVKLADFGLARAARGLSATRPGVLTGKPRYAAPERFEGREADDRADVFSLAATLYELFTGRPAFDGDDDAAVMHAVLAADAPDLASLRPDGPADLAPLLRWALARDPAARPTAEALGSPRSPAVRPPRRRRRRWPPSSRRCCRTPRRSTRRSSPHTWPPRASIRRRPRDRARADCRPSSPSSSAALRSSRPSASGSRAAGVF